MIIFQIYGEEIEYADDILGGGGQPGPPPMGVGRRSSKKMKSASGDSSSTSPERNRRDDIAIDIELERGGSGAGLSCGSTGGLGGLDGYQDGGTNQQAVSTISNIHQISASQRMDRHQASQDHWHHKSYSPASTTHASVIGGGGTTQVVTRGYSGGGRYRLNETQKNFESRTRKNDPPNPILKYLKVKVTYLDKYLIFLRKRYNFLLQ